ncbi:zinc finger, CCHC-type, retrotransposon gag domain protein [Tanacetum coccineum]
MVNVHYKEVLKASTSKGLEPLTNDADHNDNDNESSFSFEDLNFRGFTDEETRVLSTMIARQVGKAIKNVMTYYISRTTDNLKEVIQKELEGWLSAVEGAFHTSCCLEKNKVNFASNFIRDSTKMWWDGKVCEKGEEWIGSYAWKEFKEFYNVECAPAKEVDKIQEEFQTLMKTNETVNELWKKFIDVEFDTTP